MSCYKPNTQEENYVNVAYLYRNFWNDMHAFVWEYQDIQSKYYNTESAYNAFWQGRINPYCYGAEAEMRMLAYKIYGYSINVFEIVAYSLECWKIQQNSNPKGSKVTDKQYDQGIRLLARKGVISNEKKEKLLRFRIERNAYAHNGREIFCRYIFDNVYVIFNLIENLVNLLACRISEEQFLYILEVKSHYIEEMQDVMESCRILTDNVDFNQVMVGK